MNEPVIIKQDRKTAEANQLIQAQLLPKPTLCFIPDAEEQETKKKKEKKIYFLNHFCGTRKNRRIVIEYREQI